MTFHQFIDDFSLLCFLELINARQLSKIYVRHIKMEPAAALAHPIVW